MNAKTKITILADLLYVIDTLLFDEHKSDGWGYFEEECRLYPWQKQFLYGVTNDAD